MDTSPSETRSFPFKPNSSIVHRYIKWVSFLILFVVIVSSVTVFIAYKAMGAEFDTDVLTENDIPLAIGGGAAAGVGVGMVLLSVFSPINLIKGDGVIGDLTDEIELPERENKDKKTKDKTGDDAAENQRRRQAADEKMRKSKEKARKRNIKNNKKNTRRRRLKANRRLRGLRKAPKGVRFMRGFFRLLFRR